MDRAKLINSLAGVRIVIGLASWLMPRPAGRLFGLDSKGNPQAPYLARLFGVRDVALAYGALSSEGETQRQWLTVGVACDMADAVAGYAGARRGYLPKFAGVLVTGTALLAAALGVGALREQ